MASIARKPDLMKAIDLLPAQKRQLKGKLYVYTKDVGGGNLYLYTF